MSKTIRLAETFNIIIGFWIHVLRLQSSLVDEGWYLAMIIDSLLTSISASSMDLKRNSTDWDYLGFWSRWNLYNRLVRRLRPQSSSLSPSSSPCWSSGNHPQRLFEKTIESFDCKINCSALGAALTSTLRPAVPVSGTLAQRWRVGRVSTNTGHFRVGSSRCGLPLLLYWLVWESKRF